MAVNLLSNTIEVGLVTTNLAAMVEFYEGFLGLPHQGDIDFADISMKRYALGRNIIKLVSFEQPPAEPVAPGGGRAQAGIRYLTLVVASLGETARMATEAGYHIVEPIREFPGVPGTGWFFVADPDGNWVELVGPL